MPAYSRLELATLGASTTADAVERWVDRSHDPGTERDLPLFSYPLDELQSALSMFDRLSDGHPSVARSPGVVAARSIIGESKHRYSHRSVFVYVGFVTPEGRKPEPAEALADLLRVAHRTAGDLGTLHGMRVGALRFPGFTCGSVFPLDPPARRELEASGHSEQDFWDDAGGFVSTLRDGLDALWASAGLEAELRCVAGVACGLCEFDAGILEPDNPVHAHLVVAELAGVNAFLAGRLGKLKAPFEGLLGELAADRVNVLGTCVDAAVGARFAETFHAGASPLARCGDHDVYRLALAAPRGDRGRPGTPVCAIAVDIGNSTAANRVVPDTLATYRHHLRRNLAVFTAPRLYSGIWTGDGLQLICFLPPGERERLGALTALIDQVRTFVRRQSSLRHESAQLHLRVGVDYALEPRSFVRVMLGPTSNNAEVEACESEALLRAEALQESLKDASGGAGAGDAIAFSGRLREFVRAHDGARVPEPVERFPERHG